MKPGDKVWAFQVGSQEIFELSPQQKKEIEELRKILSKGTEKMFDEKNRAIEAWVELCLRTRVNPPIRGEITRGKVKWRGLAICRGLNYEFLGILQRGKTLYHIDGNTYQL